MQTASTRIRTRFIKSISHDVKSYATILPTVRHWIVVTKPIFKALLMWGQSSLGILYFWFLKPGSKIFLFLENISISRSRDRNPSNFTLDCVSDFLATKRTTLAKGIFKVFYFSNSSSSLCLHFLYPIGNQSAQFSRRALHYASGGQQFLRQRAQPPWGSIYIYIYIWR